MTNIPWRWIFLIVILFSVWKYWHASPADLAPSDPKQTYSNQGVIYQQGNYQLEVLANYDIEARVLSKRFYDSGEGSDLIPVDLALGWGSMSNSAVLDRLTITQANRYYYYRWESEPPIPPTEIVNHSANTHLIPINAEIEKQIKEIRVGHVVHIVGQLVEARNSSGWHWRSSLSREDTGYGACELIRVESINFR